MGELLLDVEGSDASKPWSVERRFRVTEVFLAVLWVCSCSFSTYGVKEDIGRSILCVCVGEIISLGVHLLLFGRGFTARQDIYNHMC
jgi:hypothetical protein